MDPPAAEVSLALMDPRDLKVRVEIQVLQVLPDRRVVKVTLDHPVFLDDRA